MVKPTFIVISTGYESRLADVLEQYPPVMFKKVCPELLEKVDNKNLHSYSERDVDDDELGDIIDELEEETVNTSKLLYFQGQPTHWVRDKTNFSQSNFVDENLDQETRTLLDTLLPDIKQESFAVYSGDYLRLMSAHRRGHGQFGYCATFDLESIDVVDFGSDHTALVFEYDAESG